MNPNGEKMVLLIAQTEVTMLHIVGEMSQSLEQGLDVVASSSVVTRTHNMQAALEGFVRTFRSNVIKIRRSYSNDRSRHRVRWKG